MKKSLLLFLMICATSLFAADRYALIIAVGDYEFKTGWPSISSTSDVPLIKNALLNQKFSEDHIEVIQNEQATKEGILAALQRLYQKAKPGDIVVVHYSGHGQQVLDVNGDEADGLDEALVPYDAQAYYSKNPLYIGQNHIIDDELEIILNNFRNKLGKDGQLLFILDSCHSGAASRGNTGEIKTRGGVSALVPSGWKPASGSKTENRGSAYMETEAAGGQTTEAMATLSHYFTLSPLKETPAPFILISGASANELNYEYNGTGSLSYAFAKSMNELGNDFSYRQLFGNIAAVMNGIAPKQKPVIEGDIDAKLFKNEYVKQALYYEVNDLTYGKKVLTINGGQVNSIFEGTTVMVLPMGSAQADPSKVLAKGKVTNAGFASAVIELEQPLKEDNAKKYWVFIDQPSYSDIAINVYLGSTVTDLNIIKGVQEYLVKNHLGQVVKDINASDVTVDYTSGTYVVGATKGENAVGDSSKNRGNELEGIEKQLFGFAQGNYLKNLNVNSEGYAFNFELIPVDYNPATRKVNGILDPKTMEVDGTFEVQPKQDYVVLKINNESNQSLYISIVEIDSQGQISAFFPNNKCKLTDNERQIPANSSHTYENCVYSFAPPYERLILKAFASNSPLNLSTVASRGPAPNNNPLEKFVKNTYVQNRGSDSEETGDGLVGGSAQFLYEIVERK